MLKTESKESGDKSAIKTREAIIFIGLGLALTLLTIILDHENAISKLGLLLDFLSHVGLGLVIIGLLTILLDFNHWTHYFEKRLSNIVTEKQYLQTLDKDSLAQLQTEVLKAYFNNNEIGGSDGFLTHYQKNIQSLINTPFRTNVNLVYMVDYLDGDLSKLLVNERMSWICKRNGGEIQRAVRWMPSEYEVETLEDFTIVLQHETLKSKEHDKGEISFSRLDPKGKLVENEKNSFTLPLDDYIGLDGLWVQIIVNYTIPLERIIAKRMAYPTRGINLSVQYPKNDFVVATEPYFNGSRVSTTTMPGNFHLSSEDWIMPDEGITVQLLKKMEPYTKRPAGTGN
jgi:hypothetical protein